MVEKNSPRRSTLISHIIKVCESNYFECSTKDEVENDKENTVVEKSELIIKKDMDNKIWSPQYGREF